MLDIQSERTIITVAKKGAGDAGHRTVLHLSSAWGGLEQRKPLIESILSYVFPTAPKLRPQPGTLT